jgi:hypothetical protein
MKIKRVQEVVRVVLTATLLVPAVAVLVGCGSSGEGQIGTAQVGPRPNRGPRVTVKDGQPPLAPTPDRGRAGTPRPPGPQ